VRAAAWPVAVGGLVVAIELAWLALITWAALAIIR
jgi:hypothetical protein